MPLTERDPNVSGRTSRASITSAGSKGAQRTNEFRSDSLVAPPGVMSMLRTSTELGDLGFLHFNPARAAAPPHSSRRSSGVASRLSTDSSVSHVNKRASNHRQWPSASSGPRKSITSTLTVPQRYPDTMIPALVSLPSSLQDGRSFSLTHNIRSAHGLPNHRSLTSLRGHDPISRPRSPYRYPTRLKRPGYRPSSPALSDVTGLQPQRIHASGLDARRRPSHTGPLPDNGEQYPLPYPQARNRSAPSVPTMLSVNGSHRPYPPNRNVSSSALDVPTMAAARSHSSGARTPSTEPRSSSPSTPNDPSPAQVVINHAATLPVSASETEYSADLGTAGPMYYDYSEQFEKEAHPVPQGSTVPLGFVQRIRTILEERNKGGALPTSPSGSISMIAELPGSDIAELPGSPAPPMTPAIKRITRELILAAMSPSSEVPTTGENTASDCEARRKTQNKEDPEEDAQLPDESKSVSAEKREDSVPESISHTSAEISGSAVVDFAVGHSMPGSFDSRGYEVDLLSHDAQPASKAEAPCIGKQSDAESKEDQSPPIIATLEQAILPSAQRPHSTMLPSSPPAASDNGLSISNNQFSAPSSQYSSPQNGSDGLSQAITDFAQRFSVPQYVAVQEPPTDSPLPAAAVSPIAVTITDATTTNTDLSASVPPHSLSPVSALEETPKSRDSNTTTHLVWPQRHAVSAAENLGVSKVSEIAAVLPQDSVVAAPRVSLPHSSPSHLSDVNEEPGEEGSIPDFRVASFKFPLPKAASLRISTEKNCLSERSPRASTRRNTCGTLADTRGIPSLNFSKTDLFAKLNEAFEHRTFRSVDGIPQTFPELHAPAPERPASSGFIRDKYRSLFTSLDNVDPIAEETIQDPTMTVVPTHRPLSPDELIAEVDRLSIPSVNQLTQRLSELLPSLKRYCSSSDQGEGVVGDDTVESTINAIRGLGRHEPVAKEADLELLDNIEQHKPAPRNLDGQRIEKLADTPDETTDSSNNLSNADKRRSAASAGIARRTPVAELEAPLPAVIRVRSAGGDTEEDLEQKRSLTARVSRRSLVSSPSARPWNLEASYPWGSTPMVDISFPAPTHQRDGPEHKPSRLRLRVSNYSLGSRDTVRLGSGGSPTTGDNTENTNDTFKRRASKKSLIGSIQRRIGLGGPIDNSGYATGPHLHHKEERAVDPGDRYPTTGLSPPSNFNIEECRSFFSDDSSQTHRNNSFRKRLTHLKAKLPPMARSHSAMDSRSIGNLSDSLFGGHAADGDSVRTHDGPGGMSKTEFRARRLLEKVKMLWFRSGELIRSMSGRKKQEEAHAWIEESEISAYSGV